MNIGFMGAHRTGKSTLAKAVCEELGIEFKPFDTKSCWDKHGFNPQNPLNEKDKADLQGSILELFEDMIRSGAQVFDRTPFDFIAYTKMAIHEMNMAEYYMRCSMDVWLLDVMFLIQPGIPVVFDPKSFGADTQEEHHRYTLSEAIRHPAIQPYPLTKEFLSVIKKCPLELAAGIRPMFIMPQHVTNHAERLSLVMQACEYAVPLHTRTNTQQVEHCSSILHIQV